MFATGFCYVYKVDAEEQEKFWTFTLNLISLIVIWRRFSWWYFHLNPIHCSFMVKDFHDAKKKWKFVDIPLLLTVLLVKIKIFEVRFFQRLYSILTVGFQSFTNDPINFIIDFSLNYKKSSKTLEFKFEPLPLLSSGSNGKLTEINLSH